MKKTYLISHCIIVFASVFLLQPASVFADGGAPPPGRAAEQNRNFDWLKHTRLTMNELKGMLSLAPEQMAAWDAWNSGVMQDARQHLEHMKSVNEEKSGKSKQTVADTTPERMAREIGRLRAETTWMQEHLVQLDAAQVRTKTFYNTLDTKQKTIFDLFWHELYHRVSGHDDDLSVPEYEGPYPDSMMGEFDNPASGH